MQWILVFIHAIQIYYSQPVYTTGSVSVSREIKYFNTRQKKYSTLLLTYLLTIAQIFYQNKQLLLVLYELDNSIYKRTCYFWVIIHWNIIFIRMTDRNSLKDVPGRGLPAYLLSRNYETMRDDSDGASRILNSSSCSIMSNRDTYSNSTTQFSQNPSYLNLSSSCTGTDKTSFLIVPSTFEYMTSSMNNSIDKEAGTHKRENNSNNRECLWSCHSAHSINEGESLFNDKSVTNNYSMVSVCSRPFCLTKDYDDNISSNNNWEQNSNAVGSAEMMFPPYVSICSGIEDETTDYK